MSKTKAKEVSSNNLTVGKQTEPHVTYNKHIRNIVNQVGNDMEKLETTDRQFDSFGSFSSFSSWSRGR